MPTFNTIIIMIETFFYGLNKRHATRIINNKHKFMNMVMNKVVFMVQAWSYKNPLKLPIERVTRYRHFTIFYQLSTLVCLALFCYCLLHCDKMSFSRVCEAMCCKVFYLKQRKSHLLLVIIAMICLMVGAVLASCSTYDDHLGTRQNIDVKLKC